MEEYLGYLNKQRRKRRDFITCGSWQVAHKKIDLENWRTNQRHSGFLPAEQNWMDEIIDGMGYVDAYREVDSEGGTYSFWTSEEAFAENDGFRFDYQIATSNMKHRVLHSGMYSGRLFSRHAPVIVDYDWELSF